MLIPPLEHMHTGFYVTQVDAEFCGSAIECAECVEGMICQGDGDERSDRFRNQRLEDIQIVLGMYRSSADSLTVVECPKLGACQGNNTHGDALCAAGHIGPMCQVCSVGVFGAKGTTFDATLISWNTNLTYVWSAEICVPCDSGHEAAMYGLLTMIIVIMLLLSAYLIRKRELVLKTMEDYGIWDGFIDDLQTKYKIVLRLLQTLSKITVLYPGIIWPSTFNSIFSFLDGAFPWTIDINLLPMNCVYATDFHQKLLAITLMPILFVVCVMTVYSYQHYKLLVDPEDVQAAAQQLASLQSKTMYVVVVFLYTVFTLVSSTILQTFNYDGRLDGEDYLAADYSIRVLAPQHQAYKWYAVFMSLVYCCGIPLVSWVLLYWHKADIQALQTAEFGIVETNEKLDELKVLIFQLGNHKQGSANRIARAQFKGKAMLEAASETEALYDELATHIEAKNALEEGNHWLLGLSPLYRDYEAEFWWFEILQFAVTLFLSGVAASLPVSSSSVVFIALMVSFAMSMTYANTNPFIVYADDILAQIAQVSITLSLSVGLLTLTTENASDGVIGYLLVFVTLIAIALPFMAIFVEVVFILAPDKTARIKAFFRYGSGGDGGSNRDGDGSRGDNNARGSSSSSSSSGSAVTITTTSPPWAASKKGTMGGKNVRK
jgi:hypothetical protein